MRLRHLMLSAVAAGAVIGLGSAQAAIMELDPDGSDNVNLAAVLDGDNTVRVGDKDFDFQEPTFQANGGASQPSASDINLFGSTNTAGDFGLKFQFNGFNVGTNQSGNGQSVDGLLEFTVTANDPNLVINDVSMSLTGGASAGTGSASIVEGVQTEEGGSALLDENLFVADNPGFDRLEDEAFLSETQNSIFVTKDIGVSSGTDGSAQISTFRQHFSQIPEPASAALLATGIGLVAAGQRRQRRDR